MWQFDETKEPHQKLEAALKEAGWLDGSTADTLDDFARFVGTVKRTSNTEVFWNVLAFSWAVTSVADLDKVLERQQVRYLRNLGDYVRILKQIPSLVEKAGKAEITVEQVLTYTP